MTQRTLRWLVWAAGLALGSAALAEEPSGPPPGGEAPTLHGKLRLSLGEAVAMGIENNLEVEIARHDPLIAFEDSRIAWGAYDPEAFAEYGFSDFDVPIASSLQETSAVSTRTWDGASGLRALVPWLGASVELAYTGEETKTNSSIQTLSPEFASTIAARAKFPLMRDLIWSEPWTLVKVSRIGSEVAQDEFRTALMDTIQSIENGYWNLGAREQDLRVAEKSLETNRALLEQTEAQYEVGVVSRVEVVEAEAGVANREFQLIVADNAYRSAQDRLVDLVLGPHLRPRSTLELELTEDPERIPVRDVDVDEATRKAFAKRPELAAARKAIEQRKVQLRFARNQRLPRLDVEGGYGYEGLAGRANPDAINFGPGPPPPITVGSRYSSTNDDFFSASGALQWSFRGLFSIPLGNVAGRHRVSRNELELRKARTEARRLEQTIILEIREAARDLLSSIQGIDAAERRQAAAAEQLRAERVRLEHGESTPFDVLQREEDLVEAQQQRIAARQAYHSSVVRLERRQGTILSRHNVVVDQASTLR